MCEQSTTPDLVEPTRRLSRAEEDETATVYAREAVFEAAGVRYANVVRFRGAQIDLWHVYSDRRKALKAVGA